MCQFKVCRVILFLFPLFLSQYACLHALPGEEDEKEHSSISRLSTHEEHVGALEDAFKRAHMSVLVTNYGDLYPAVLRTTVFTTLIPAARHRNVQIYFRLNYNDQRGAYSPIPPAVQEYFDQHGINAAWTQTHAKIVAVDHKQVMMGSFNWLTDLTTPFRSFNSTFVYEGEQAYRMTEDIWDVLKYYRNKEFGEFRANYRKAYLFKRDPYNQTSKEYTLDDDSTITYVSVIEEQRRKLLDIFERARNRIVILSPFVSRDGVHTYQRDFVQELLTTVLERGVSICFVCLPDSEERRFITYLGDLLRYPNLKVISTPNLHAKTIIMDDSLIAEGSFNWLLAARDEIYHTHKHEATLICEGPKGQDFIQSFYQTSPGRLAWEAMRDMPSPSSTLSPEDDQRAFFSDRKVEIERDMWVHYPFWIDYYEGYTSLVYGKYFEVMSGELFGRQGYCVRVNKQYYLTAGQNILYFDTPQEAKAATFDLRFLEI